MSSRSIRNLLLFLPILLLSASLFADPNATPPDPTVPTAPTVPTPPPPAPSDTPVGPTSSLASLQRAVEMKKYHEVLPILSRILSARPDDSLDRYPYLMLKAECHLQIKDSSLAISTLALASKSTPDLSEQRLADATAFLIKRSTGFRYIPKHTEDKDLKHGIDILDKVSRQRAFAFLLEDEMANVALPVKQAKAANSLVPIVDAAKLISILPALEFAATGETDKIEAEYASLGDHALDLMTKAIDDMTDTHDVIRRRADTVVTVTVTLNGQNLVQNQRTGLTPADKRTLLNIMDTCKKLTPAAEILQSTLGMQSKSFQTILDDADKLNKAVVVTIAKG